ncbi:hypothetical protein ACTWP6_29065 [Mycobacterium sp. 4D054]|uniref:hypothetical protein n=1 Tax=unclassified Mycobacterium TaxID=2642494 RepID=UPI0021B4C369|nr:hypothetical protein [Mycobacterium sp. SMC-8]
MTLGAEAARRLDAAGTVTIERGMSDDELDRVEHEVGVEFADDHRAFLAAGLPTGGSWPNWRAEGRRSLTRRLQLPIVGVLFAVEWDRFWYDGWGRRPAQTKHALRTARYHLERAPMLVPICSHHYLPAGHGLSGHPVLSVVRTDVVIRGANLADYVSAEFGTVEPDARQAAVTVEFWSTLLG